MARVGAKLKRIVPANIAKIIVVFVALAAAVGTGVAYAESYPGGSDNGKTSHIKQLSDDLAGLGYGSIGNTPDWGANWNRIATASKWTPQGDVSPSDVRAGKKFYNGNRSQQTGTMLGNGPCSSQAWLDVQAQANATPATKAQAMIDNCVTDWPTASPAVAGDDKKDPISGLVWSQCLQNASGTINFASSGCTNFSRDNSAANNIGKTAIELCSERGNGWRLPTQKEMLLAYIDGGFFSLSSVAGTFWTATHHSSTLEQHISLQNGIANYAASTFSTSVRCVR